MKKLKLYYVFNTIAVIVLVLSLSQFLLFSQTKEDINSATLQSDIKYVDTLTRNISEMIQTSTKNNIYNGLKQNSQLRALLEKNMQLLATKRYKYIYVVDKRKVHDSKFRFLLDASKNLEDKSDFGESYEPLNSKEWNVVYRTKKAHYFKHKDKTSLWMTYLKPIVIDNRVKAVIVIDFSLQEYHKIRNIFSELDRVFNVTLLFYILIFLVIIIFSYIDRKREREKESAFQEIQLQKREIENFNRTLQEKVAEEVEKNRKKDQQILEQSRLAQMGEMISMIAHQWRQPLAAISATSTTINFKAELNQLNDEEAIELSNKIAKYSQHLSKTIDDFRDFFQSNKEKKESNYSEIIESVMGIIEVSIKNKNIELIKNLHSTKSFHSYPNELKQVLLNLIKNAEDVLLEKKIENPKIVIETEDNILRVSDNAGGVPEDIIEKIFDPYFSTKTAKNGTGLGLYMSKTIVEEHCKGELHVSNNKDGAVFEIVLHEEKE